MIALPTLTRANIEAALARIDREGVPPRRNATKFQLAVNGKRYPPKYVLSLASADATGRELRPKEFSGGDETNGVLQSLGFIIVGRGLATLKPDETKSSVVPERTRKAPPPPPERTAVPGVVRDPPTIVRVVVRGKTAFKASEAGKILQKAFEKWPVSGRAKFTITPGGFVKGKFPKDWSGGLGWGSSAEDLDVLVKIARPLVHACVTKEVLGAAKAKTRILTVGVDLNSAAKNAELVAVIDCDSGKIVRWTGKSYPTDEQKANLVQVSDVSTHLLEIAGEKVLVLGCHDLTMFSNRARANQTKNGDRDRRCDEMVKATERFKPTIVLHHPHSTDTEKTWRTAWAGLTQKFGSVRTYASGIAYFRWKGKKRSPLNKVLGGTRSNISVADIVVKSSSKN